MALRRGRLSTIYSIGEGRTIVLASDGCKHCIQAFSILVNSSSVTEEDSKNREEICDSLGRRAQSLQRLGSGNLEGKKGPGPLSTLMENGTDSTKKSGQGRRRTPQLKAGNLLSGLDLADPETPETSAKDVPEETPAPRPRYLAILDAEVPEESREEQELTLRASDRLIIALYTPPWQIPIPVHHDTTSPKHELGSKSFKLPSIGGFLGKKKHPKTPEQKLKKSDGDDINSPPPSSTAEEPKEGPGHTSIFMPMSEWEDVVKAVHQLEGAMSRDCLIRMAQAARDVGVRFEAVRVEEKKAPSEEGHKEKESSSSTREQSKGLHMPHDILTPSRKHSSGLGHSLHQFCEQVEAKMLILGTQHSNPTLDLHPKSFSQHLVEYCAEHCRCSVRILSNGQLQGVVDNSRQVKSMAEFAKTLELQ